MAENNRSLKLFALEIIHQFNDNVVKEVTLRAQQENQVPHCLLDTKQLLLPAIKDKTDALTVLHLLGEVVTSTLKEESGWTDRIEKVQMLLDLIWEKLHTGVWKDVGMEWRILFGLSCLIQACLVITDDEQNGIKAMQLCDKALMMGHPVLSPIVHVLIKKLTHVLIELSDNCSSPQMTDSVKSLKELEAPIIESPIKRCRDVDLHIFRTQLFGVDPVVILGMMEHWPSLSSRKWNLHYIMKVAGFRTVPVEIGSKYTDPDWRQQLMLLSEFIQSYVASENPPHIAYLAQHTLFDQIPILREDILIPDYCAISDASNEDEEVRINAWFGPPGTVSPLHYDPPHNLLCQVIGRKYIRLYNPSFTSCLYPHEDKLLHNTSRIDIEKPDYISFPKFKEAKFIETILSPGQMLYIPPGWWHFVKSLELSFSVSFWWQ